MNEHIKRGNDALRNQDFETAKREFYEALGDSDDLVQRIARNRLLELFPSIVYASTHSSFYHRANCIAVTHGIWSNHKIEFRDWLEAEDAGYSPCEKCKPPQIRPRFNR